MNQPEKTTIQLLVEQAGALMAAVRAQQDVLVNLNQAAHLLLERVQRLEARVKILEGESG